MSWLVECKQGMLRGGGGKGSLEVCTWEQGGLIMLVSINEAPGLVRMSLLRTIQGRWGGPRTTCPSARGTHSGQREDVFSSIALVDLSFRNAPLGSCLCSRRIYLPWLPSEKEWRFSVLQILVPWEPPQNISFKIRPWMNMNEKL